MKLGPQSKNEASVFALEELRADVQYEILKRMKQMGLNQAALARRLGKSPAWVSQILDDDANLTLETIAKVFLALDSKCHVAALPDRAVAHDLLWERFDPTGWDQMTQFSFVSRLEAADAAYLLGAGRDRPVFERRSNDNDPQASASCLEAA